MVTTIESVLPEVRREEAKLQDVRAWPTEDDAEHTDVVPGGAGRGMGILCADVSED